MQALRQQTVHARARECGRQLRLDLLRSRRETFQRRALCGMLAAATDSSPATDPAIDTAEAAHVRPPTPSEDELPSATIVAELERENLLTRAQLFVMARKADAARSEVITPVGPMHRSRSSISASSILEKLLDSRPLLNCAHFDFGWACRPLRCIWNAASGSR